MFALKGKTVPRGDPYDWTSRDHFLTIHEGRVLRGGSREHTGKVHRAGLGGGGTARRSRICLDWRSPMDVAARGAAGNRCHCHPLRNGRGAGGAGRRHSHSRTPSPSPEIQLNPFVALSDRLRGNGRSPDSPRRHTAQCPQEYHRMVQRTRRAARCCTSGRSGRGGSNGGRS